MKLTNNIQQAISTLRAGGVVAFPTETVYGLGADAQNKHAVAKVFAIKERPLHHPLIVHLAHIAQIKEWATHVPEAAYRLASIFWPGPLTLLLKKQKHVLEDVTGGQDTIGLRIPKGELATALLEGFGAGIAAPSANKFTRISPTQPLDVLAELGDEVDLILDGGPCQIGLESTILDLSADEPTIIRPGMINAQDIAEVLSMPVHYASDSPQALLNRACPGNYPLHYAPRTKTRLIATDDLNTWAEDPAATCLPAALVLHSPLRLDPCDAIYPVTLPAVAEDYAKALYRTLRALDTGKFKCIFVEQPPLNDAWHAIWDRLFKACGGSM